MLKITTFILFMYLATASVFNASLAKELFFVSYINQLPYKLLHTQAGIIAYSVEDSSSALTPQYILMNPQAGTTELILSNLTDSCNQKGQVVFDRLHYNPRTSSLIYYCTANNSLLILDEQDFSVVDVIPTEIQDTFTEAKLSSDGELVFVLGMGELFITQTPSQLVKIDLVARKLVDVTKLDKYLNDGEVVDGFFSSNNEAYISTNRVNDGIDTVSILSFTQMNEDYELKPITELSYPLNPAMNTTSRPITQLYCLGDYIVTNNDTTLVFLNKSGELVSSMPPIFSKAIEYANISSPYNVAFVRKEESQDLYAFFQNYTLVKYSFDGADITVTEIGRSGDVQLAFGTQSTHDVLFLEPENQESFTILDLETSEKIYQSVGTYSSYILTESTYCVLVDKLNDEFGINQDLHIYNLSTNNLIAKHPLFGEKSYVDQDTNTLYYLDRLDNRICGISKIDLTKGSRELLVTLAKEYKDVCTGSITQVNLPITDVPELVISMSKSKYYILTKEHGFLSFDPSDENGYYYAISFDFETSSLSYINSTGVFPTNLSSVTQYEYVPKDGFILKRSYDINDLYAWSYIPLADQKIVSIALNFFTVIDLKTGSLANYTIPIYVASVTTFHDKVNRDYLVLSAYFDFMLIGGYTASKPYILDENGLSPLPYAGGNTVQAGAAGVCSYWTVDVFISSIARVKFYSCSGEIKPITE